MSDINVTPLVDVMLVLLIVFMVTAPLLTTGLHVDLPEVNAANTPVKDEALSVKGYDRVLRARLTDGRRETESLPLSARGGA